MNGSALSSYERTCCIIEDNLRLCFKAFKSIFLTTNLKNFLNKVLCNLIPHLFTKQFFKGTKFHSKYVVALPYFQIL